MRQLNEIERLLVNEHGEKRVRFFLVSAVWDIQLDRVTLTVPSEFVASEINKRLLPDIRALIREHFGSQCEFTMRVGDVPHPHARRTKPKQLFA